MQDVAITNSDMEWLNAKQKTSKQLNILRSHQQKFREEPISLDKRRKSNSQKWGYQDKKHQVLGIAHNHRTAVLYIYKTLFNKLNGKDKSNEKNMENRYDGGGRRMYDVIVVLW